MPRTKSKKSPEKERMGYAGKKAIWSGFLSFGLVSVPVSVYSPFAEHPVSFNMLHRKCLTPIRYKRWCDSCKREVAFEEVVKGYRISKDQYVVITKEEFEGISIPTARSIEVEEFVSGVDIEPVYYDKSYYLLPDKGGEHAFYLLMHVAESLGRVAVAKVALRNKEELVLLRPYRGALLMTVLHYPQEILDISKIITPKELGPIALGKEEEKLARQLVDSMTKELDLAKYRDEYRLAIQNIVESKLAGRPVPKAPQVVRARSLVEALKKSVAKSKR